MRSSSYRFFEFYIGFNIPRKIHESRAYTEQIKSDLEAILQDAFRGWEFNPIRIQEGYTTSWTFSLSFTNKEGAENVNRDLSKKALIKPLDDKYQLAQNGVEYTIWCGFRPYPGASSVHEEWYSGYDYEPPPPPIRLHKGF